MSAAPAPCGAQLQKVALVVGGTGLASSELAPMLLNEHADEFSDVVVLSRTVNADSFKPKIKTDRAHTSIASAKLEDIDSIASALSETKLKVTHLFWCLRASAEGPSRHFGDHTGDIIAQRRELTKFKRRLKFYKFLFSLAGKRARSNMYQKISNVNYPHSEAKAAFLDNTLAALAQTGSQLEHVTLITGASAYGMGIGPLFEHYEQPFDEDASRRVPLKHFVYYDWEDTVRQKSKEHGFRHTILRPSIIVGTKLNPRPTDDNLALYLGVYIFLLKATGKPLVFPGSHQAWHALASLSSADDIAHLAVWASRPDTAASNEALNVASSNFRWSDGTWARLAEHFGMECVEPEPGSLGESASSILGDSIAEVWDKYDTARGLKLEEIFYADYFDVIFSINYDAQLSDAKLQRLGAPIAAASANPNSASGILGRAIENYVSYGFIPPFSQIASK